MQVSDRLEIWRALSELFLDNEIDMVTYQQIAEAIRNSAYSVEQVEDILWAEVYPVLKQNLTSVAGIWDGWSDSWLQENLQAYEDPGSVRNKSIFSQTTISIEIKKQWLEVKRLVNQGDMLAK